MDFGHGPLGVSAAGYRPQREICFAAESGMLCICANLEMITNEMPFHEANMLRCQVYEPKRVRYPSKGRGLAQNQVARALKKGVTHQSQTPGAGAAASTIQAAPSAQVAEPAAGGHI